MAAREGQEEMATTKPEVVRKAERLVVSTMGGRDASHDAAHAFRVRDLALSLAKEEGLVSSPQSLEIVELAALLHDIGDYKYTKDLVEDTTIVEKFLEEEVLEESKREKILGIIKGMGFKNEVAQLSFVNASVELGVVQDADRLDAIGAIGIARCFTFGGSTNQILHDPDILPRQGLSKEAYMKKEGKQTTINHFHEKLFKLKDLMKTKCRIRAYVDFENMQDPLYWDSLTEKFQAGKERAERRHKFMQDFVAEFYDEWSGRA